MEYVPDQLQQLTLTVKIDQSGRKLGTGAYGEVIEVNVCGLKCAGKILHKMFLDQSTPSEQKAIKTRFMEECLSLSKLCHPNIVQLIGIHYIQDMQLPMMVMELLPMSLTQCLEKNQQIPVYMKTSILCDVSVGLLYMHNQNPALIHRDLTANNVLLTTNLTAKLADMGVARIMSLNTAQLSARMTQCPGTPAYMPPEALSSKPQYSEKLDVFSFGNLILHVCTHQWPIPEPLLQYDPQNPANLKPLTEVQRRLQYLHTINKQNPLRDIAEKCLDNLPHQRPSTANITSRLQELRQLSSTPVRNFLEMAIEIMSLRKKQAQMREEIHYLKQQMQRNQDHSKHNEMQYLTISSSSTINGTSATSTKTKDNPYEDVDGLLRTAYEDSQKKSGVHLYDDVEVLVSSATGRCLPMNQTGDKTFAHEKENPTQSTEYSAYPTAPAQLGMVQPDQSHSDDKSYIKKWEIDRSTLKFLKRLSVGMCHVVWEGLWNEVTPVAVKTTTSKAGVLVNDFVREAKLMMEIDHPNLLKLYAVCLQEEPIQIVTELMRHGNLRTYLRSEENRHISLLHMIDMVAQISSGMAYLEEHSYIHCDVAARNILVGEANVCKVGDFHLAQVIKEDFYSPEPGAKFAIKWTAPEAALYNRFSIKSDVWSFGILVSEVIRRGYMPYPGMTNREVLAAVDKGYRMPKPEGCPNPLYEIMLKCWQAKPEERPTFEALKHMLGDYLFHEAVESRQQSLTSLSS